MERRIVYMDNAATTAVDRSVLDEMIPYFCDEYGNPSGTCTFSAKARNAVNNARTQVAKLIGAYDDEIIFTSGGTEADNIAIFGSVYEMGKKDLRIITSRIEHPAVLNSFKELEKRGFEAIYLPCNDEGLTDIDQLDKIVNDNTGLVSIMAANNELGTVQDIEKASKAAHKYGTLFHTDAVQAAGHITVDVKKSGIDMLSMSSHKLNGPKGIGALFVRRGIKLHSPVYGGGQEKGFRSGTLNVPAIVGFGKACEIARENLENRMRDGFEKKHFLVEKIKENIDGVCVNGTESSCLPGVVSLSFERIEGSSLIIELDMRGICCSTGSACSAHSNDVSHVLLAAGYDASRIRGSVRLSFSHETGYDDLEYVVWSLKESVEKLRNLSI